MYLQERDADSLLIDYIFAKTPLQPKVKPVYADVSKLDVNQALLVLQIFALFSMERMLRAVWSKLAEISKRQVGKGEQRLKMSS